MKINGKQKLVGQQTKLLTGGSRRKIGVVEGIKERRKMLRENTWGKMVLENCEGCKRTRNKENKGQSDVEEDGWTAVVRDVEDGIKNNFPLFQRGKNLGRLL